MLDLAAYPRRAHFDYFRQMTNPYLSVTASCDITALRRLTQERPYGDPRRHARCLLPRLRSGAR